MAIAAELYALQEIDSAIDVAQATLAAVEEHLGETEELTSARAAVEEHREALRGLHDSQRDIEWQVDDARSHVTAVESKLYGGTVRNPKELSGLNDDANMLKGQLRRREDELLNHMVKVEEQEAALRQAEAVLKEVEGRWRGEQADLLGQKERLEAELTELESSRQAQAGRVDGRVLDLYGLLRDRRQGKAVVKVERGMCQGCRISLPMSVLQKARSGFDVVQCVSCERILYVS
jgi:predicted  nucleic acid-binding Zn-ribbon protein